jgi:O-antigen/teichoic acid export membrane protein
MLAAGSNAALNYILIPKLGILGAGIATTTSSLFAGTFNQIVSNRLYLIPNKWKSSFFIIVLFTALVSFLQHKLFVFNINNMPIMTRILVTIVLLALGITLFYKDIRDSGVLKGVVGKILKKESQLALRNRPNV